MGYFARLLGWIPFIQICSIVIALATSMIQTNRILKKGNQIIGVSILGGGALFVLSLLLAKKNG
jgi:hypothetical protein